MVPGRYVMLAVQDTGEGMDAEVRDRIFIPFFTTKAMGKGTGLGLATVYGIIKQHGGYIWVDSEPGRGTTFKIHLPAMEAPAPVEEVPLEESTAFRGTETVMVVEDNDMVRDLAVRVLLHLGYRVLAAESGAECLRMLGDHSGPLDLLLTDVVMPEMNGKVLFEQVSARFPHVKVLYMSGYAEDVIAHRGVLDEDVNFIQKPFSLQSLAAKVREVLEGQNGGLRPGTQDSFGTTGAGRHR